MDCQGTTWLLILCVAATLFGLLFAIGFAKPPSARTALGWAGVALSPTVFAYPVNVLVLALAIVELVLALRGRGRRRGASGATEPPGGCDA